jgi:hypothetical protein
VILQRTIKILSLGRKKHPDPSILIDDRGPTSDDRFSPTTNDPMTND